MKISYNWLKEIYPAKLTADDAAALLTACGLEVENIESFDSVKGGMKGLLVGEVLTCIKHPDADKLKLTTVNVGSGEPLQIVCGGPNVAAGQKVIVAPPGTQLFPVKGDPFVIKSAKIRGQLSNGMICAEDEIGIGESHAGVIVLPDSTPVGMPASEYYKIESDSVFEIGLTPNRADAASHIGVARDLAAVVRTQTLIETGKDIHLPLNIPDAKKTSPAIHMEVKVNVLDKKACLRYSGISIANVKVQESPAWLKNRLTSIGVHPINNIVDITNYVLHECGQPLHAFDLDTIAGKTVVVRTASPNEKFTTLDNVERNLSTDDLLICDEKSPMCIAGVFGGLHSGITAETKNVFLESACFSPASIRKTSKRHALKTDASFRFERGTDPEITIYALIRAAAMICEIAGGKIASEISDTYPEKVLPVQMNFSRDFMEKFSGVSIEQPLIKIILQSLGVKILSEEKENLKLEIPSFKVDVTRPVDVVEEVLRIYGYDRIPLMEKMTASLPAVSVFDPWSLQNKVANYLSASGFIEMLSNSLTKEESAFTEAVAIKLLNPLSQELSVLRTDMLSTTLLSLQYNLNRRQSNLKLFEFGKVYEKSDNAYKEYDRFSITLSGNTNEESWLEKQSPVSIFLLKAVVKNILVLCGIEGYTESASGNKAFSQGLTLLKNNETLVDFGTLDKKTLKNFDISQHTLYAELYWNTILKYARKKPIRFKEFSKFPSVKRDLSMLVKKEVSFHELEQIAYRTEKKLLTDIRLFDVYEGEKIESGKKSCALSFILQDDQHTLTDHDINKVMDKLMAAYEKEAGAEIRKG